MGTFGTRNGGQVDDSDSVDFPHRALDVAILLDVALAKREFVGELGADEAPGRTAGQGVKDGDRLDVDAGLLVHSVAGPVGAGAGHRLVGLSDSVSESTMIDSVRLNSNLRYSAVSRRRRTRKPRSRGRVVVRGEQEWPVEGRGVAV